MDATRWQEVQSIFDEAIALHPEDRVAYLSDICNGDADLRHEVESLLEAEGDEAYSFIDRPIQRIDEKLAAMVKGPATEGDRIGAYEIIQQIGKGGMGRVYLARRVDGQFDQEVALKVMRRELSEGEGQDRFLRERQILARLSHPNIAQLLDGGVTEDGVPYYVMEHIDGLPIMTYCDRHRLAIDARLQLFQSVCTAVQYAHRNLVVHRDLKPSNILVTNDGVVKLLDFGIAKLLDKNDGPFAFPPTRTGLWVMTPEYAAPEQVRRESITTATDIYALGVVLYELLTGHRPYRITMGQSPGEVEHLICEVDPQRPSAVVGQGETWVRAGGKTAEVTPEQIVQARNTKVDRLTRHLRGDLDNIVLKALRKEPERRYRSAEQLREDIQRYFTGLPIFAREDHWRYRTTKFIRRHKMMVGLLATIVTMLLVLVVGAISFALLTNEQADEIIQERDRAQLGEQKANQIKDLLMDVFEVSNVGQLRGESVTAMALLDEGVARVEHQLQDQPEVQAEMFSVLGRAYRRLGEYERARPFFERAINMRRNLFDGDQPDLVASLMDLGQLYLDQGAYDQAVERFQKALDMHQRLLGQDHIETVNTLTRLAEALSSQGQDVEAESLYVNLWMNAPDLLDEPHAYMADARLTWAGLLMHRGALDAAEVVLDEAEDLIYQLYGNEHTAIAALENQQGLLLQAQGRYPEAAARFRKAFQLYKDLRGEKHPSTLPVLTNLARTLRLQADLEGAKRVLSDILVMAETRLGAQHPEVGHIKRELGAVLQEQGAYDEAEAIVWDAYTMLRAHFGVRHLFAAETYTTRIGLLQIQGAYGEAELHLKAALSIIRKQYGEMHPETARAVAQLGQLLLEAGEYDEAEVHLRQSLEVRQRLFGNQHLDVAESLYNMGRFYADKGLYDRAGSALWKAYNIRHGLLGEANGATAETRIALAEVLYAEGRIDDAEQMYREALTAYRQVYGPAHPDVARPMTGLATLYGKRNRYRFAESLFQDAMQLTASVYPSTHIRWAVMLQRYGCMLREQGRIVKAGPPLRRAVEILEAHQASDNWMLAAAKGDLGAWYAAQGQHETARVLLNESNAILQKWSETHADTRRIRQYQEALEIDQGRK